MRLRSGPNPVRNRLDRGNPPAIRLGDHEAEAKEGLRLGLEALAEAGATAWVTYGTLLGLIREGRLLPHDSDIDIALVAGADPERIDAAMAARGLVPLLDQVDEQGVIKQKFAHGPVVLDLFFLRAEGTGYADYCTLMKRSLVRSTHPPVVIENRVIGDLTVPVPRDTEAHLVHLYGPGWRTPVTRWSWYLSPPNAELIVHWAELPRLAERVWRFRRSARG